jgi:hypothetical protein
MQYLLLIATDESADEALSPAESEARTAEYGAWVAQCAERGALRGGERLRPTADATTVRLRDGEVVTVDGPFAETKEQIAGYFVIEVDDLDQAVQAASMLPGAKTGSVEVRPIWPMDMDGHA